MATIEEQQAILAELHTLGMADLSALWQRAQGLGDTEFFSLVVEAFPELVAQYATTASMFQATWYEEAAPELGFVAAPAPLPELEQYGESARWAMATGGPKTLEKLSGSFQRGVWSAARNTVIHNAGKEKGATWARYASANACPFCRLLATRGAVYASKAAATRVAGRGKDISTNYDPVTGKRKSGGQAKGIRVRGTQKIGDKFHDNCRCRAVEVRPGKSYDPPDYTQKWEQEYIDATKETAGNGKYGGIQLKDLMATMRQNGK
ncbi:hypothetical protein JOJ87_001436 [Rhodococcus ruber]|uniref:VG15 protein n=1 Tax=Rhodococcus ruber TaxID=1830 RepID=UPI001AE675E9|nr:hypothetical protein [Rhodococcus ruber]MBP2211092.1 hypothetical protein [Rhodococcus ruber]